MNLKEKFFRCVIRQKKLIIILFAVAVVLSIIVKPLIYVNYDMADYLPDDTPSSKALSVMEDEFNVSIPNARVMAYNITIPQALRLKAQLLAVDGVTDVTWLDDAADITIPIQALDSDTLETYYNNETALYNVTIEKEKRVSAVTAIREIIGDENSIAGTAVDTAATTELTTTEIFKVTLIALPFLLLLLLLTTTSFFEPLILLGSIVVAVILNAGSNIFFGEISFVTNASGNILLLAVSLDYSVFLLHRFKKIRRTEYDNEEAMIKTLCQSTNSVLSSGLTTIIAFVALTLMKFKIGPDIGWALAKGVTISLITVFTLTPILILSACKLIDKTAHRNFMPKFKLFGTLITKIMVPITIMFALLSIPTYLASNSNSFYYGSSHSFNEETKLGEDTQKIEDNFGKSNTFMLLVPNGDFSKQTSLSQDIHSIPQVSSVISYVDNAGAEIPTEYLDNNTYSKLISKNYSRMIINVKTDYENDEAFWVVEQLRNTAQQYYPYEYYLGGETASTYDLKTTLEADMVKVNASVIIAVFIIIMLTMKSAIIPFLLVLAIESAIWFNLAIPYFTDSPLFYIGYIIISAIQLGATIDYAIFMTDKYIELRHEYDRKDSIKKMISSLTVSILISGIAMTVMGFLLGNITTYGLISQLGYLLGRGTICSLTAVFFILPGLLYLFDKLIQKTTRNIDFINSKKEN